MAVEIRANVAAESQSRETEAEKREERCPTPCGLLAR